MEHVTHGYPPVANLLVLFAVAAVLIGGTVLLAWIRTRGRRN